MKPVVMILMGSRADEAHCQKIAEAAQSLGLDTVLRIGSAHKTGEHTLQILREWEADPRPKVIITVAGRSNALCGFVDGAVTAPVLTCPPYSENYGGADIFSALRMPSGIAPGVVLEPVNAALLAAKILGQSDPQVRARVAEFQQKQQDKIIADDQAISA